MSSMDTRMGHIKALQGAAGSEVTDRSLWDWYARSCPCGRTTGGMPRASTGPRDPAAARGRLAGVGVRGRARGG